MSSAPLLLAKAGVLAGKKFTAGFFMQMTEVFSFIEKENFIHQGIVCDGKVITGIGMFFREFAEAALQSFDYDIGTGFMRDKPEDYTEDELTFTGRKKTTVSFWKNSKSISSSDIIILKNGVDG